ncbi:hypothetical protein N481_10080 [Pseudoalteromonas luteoviolacea S4047-1]|nr:hypothetical protein N481_10080 [Pseudoalteromonas luteoviolacea S4047-1]
MTGLSACNLTTKNTGGKIPKEYKATDISIHIKEYNPHDLSLKLADRHIENSSFVVSNYSSVPDYEPGLIGGLGVVMLDSHYELHLPKTLESRLADNFALSTTLFNQMQKMKVPSKVTSLAPIESSGLNLILEPYALISVNQSRLIFSPQLIASLYDQKGKFVWRNFYGFKGKSIEMKNTWKDAELQSYFNDAYKQIATELKAHIQGKEYHRDMLGLDKKLEIEINFEHEHEK